MLELNIFTSWVYTKKINVPISQILLTFSHPKGVRSGFGRKVLKLVCFTSWVYTPKKSTFQFPEFVNSQPSKRGPVWISQKSVGIEHFYILGLYQKDQRSNFPSFVKIQPSKRGPVWIWQRSVEIELFYTSCFLFKRDQRSNFPEFVFFQPSKRGRSS